MLTMKKPEYHYRFDRAEITPTEGTDFFRAKVRLVKPGVFSYLHSDGSRKKEAKLPEHIFSDSFLKSLDGIPVLDGHPYKEGGLISSENYQKLLKGIIINPRVEENSVIADEIVFDKKLAEQIESGDRREVLG